MDAYPDLVVMGGEKDKVPAKNHTVKDGDSFELFGGDVTVKCFHTPCHTRGHVVYFLEAKGCADGIEHTSVMKDEYMVVSHVNRCVFTGDTVFIGGCGQFFEGQGVDMLRAIDKIKALPNDTKIFCGHEYTKLNMEFCRRAEPHNIAIHYYQEKYLEVLEDGKFTVPSILKNEKEYNVFMRTHSPEI